MAQSIDNIRKRLQEACQAGGLDSYQKIAENLSESYATIRRYIGGHENRVPSLEFILKVCERLDVSPEWLLFGQGPVRRGEVLLDQVPYDKIEEEALRRRLQLAANLASLEATLAKLGATREGDFLTLRGDLSLLTQTGLVRPAPPPAPPVTHKVVKLLAPGFRIVDAEQLPADWPGRYVPLIGRVAAGVGIDTSEAESYPAGLAAHYVEVAAAPPAFAVEVAGDSMSPDYLHGDLVVSDGRSPAAGGQAAIILETTTTGERIARVKRLRLRGRTAILESVNPAHAPVRVAAARIEAFAILRHLPAVRRADGPDRRASSPAKPFPV